MGWSRNRRLQNDWTTFNISDMNVPASSKWPVDTPNGGHLSPEKVTYRSKRGHFEEPGAWTKAFQIVSSFRLFLRLCKGWSVASQSKTYPLISRALLRYSSFWPNPRLPKSFWSTKKSSVFHHLIKIKKIWASIHIANVHTYHLLKNILENKVLFLKKV